MINQGFHILKKNLDVVEKVKIKLGNDAFVCIVFFKV